MFPAPQAKAPHQQPTSSRHLLRHALLLRAIPGLEYPASGPMCRRVETRLNIRKQSDDAALKRGTTTFACRIRQLRNRSSVHQPAGFVRRIGDSAYVRHQGGYVALGKGVSPGRHLSRFVQGRTAVADDGNQVRVTHLVERVALGEGMWFHRKVIHVRHPLWSGFRIVAANAVQRIELRTHRLLVPERDFVEREFDVLSGRIPRAGDEFVSPGLLSERDGGCDLAAGVGECGGWSKDHARWPAEIDSRSGQCASGGVVHLHDDRLVQRHSDIANLFAAAGLDDGSSGGGSLKRSGLLALMRASTGELRDDANNDERALHFLATSFAPVDFRDIRNAVSARASSSVMCWLGSIVPGRSD